MILWMAYLVIKGFTQIDQLGRTPPVGEGAFPLPLWSGVALAIGSVMWGNEPDTWRYGRPRFLWPLAPYAIALAIGLVLFVVGGWMTAEISAAVLFAFGPAYRDAVAFSLFGALWLGFVIAAVLQVAINDGNCYEMTNAGQNVLGGVGGWKRWYTCLIMAAVAAVFTWWFVRSPNGVGRPVEPIPEWRDAGAGNWPGIAAVLVALLFGAWGQQLFPGQTSAPSPGLVPVEAWILAGVLYLAPAALVARTANGKALLGFARPLRREARP
jgi:hypothetical protein